MIDSAMRQRITAMVGAAFDDVKSENVITPALIADRVFARIDVNQATIVEIRYCAILELRNIARQFCRQKLEGDEEDKLQHELFPELQPFYPRAVNERANKNDPQYIKLDLMSLEDKIYNVKRLRREAEAKNKHADQLEAYWGQKVAKASA